MALLYYFNFPKKSSLLMTSLYILGMRHDTFILFNFIQRSSMLMTSLFFNHEEQQFMLFKFSQKSSFLMTSLYTLGTRKGNLWWINFLPRSSLLMPSLYTLGMRNGAPAGAWSQAASHAGQKPVISWVGLRGIAKTWGGGVTICLDSFILLNWNRRRRKNIESWNKYWKRW